MNEYKIAKLFDEFDAIVMPDRPWATKNDGNFENVPPHTDDYYQIPSEKECRWLMESLLDDSSWVIRRINAYYHVNLFNTHETNCCSTPSEAYLLAAQWLKEQQAPKFKVGDLVFYADGGRILKVIEIVEWQRCRLSRCGTSNKTTLLPDGVLTPLDEAISKLKGR